MVALLLNREMYASLFTAKTNTSHWYICHKLGKNENNYSDIYVIAPIID